MSALVSLHFFMVLLTNIMYASACPLPWWLYDDGFMWHMPNCLQTFSNISKIICATSETTLSGSLYSGNILLGYLCWTLLPALHLGICFGNLHKKIMHVINVKHVSSYRFPWLTWYLMWHTFSYHLGVVLESPDKWGNFFHHFLHVSIHVNPLCGLTCQ